MGPHKSWHLSPRQESSSPWSGPLSLPEVIIFRYLSMSRALTPGQQGRYSAERLQKIITLTLMLRTKHLICKTDNRDDLKLLLLNFQLSSSYILLTVQMNSQLTNQNQNKITKIRAERG